MIAKLLFIVFLLFLIKVFVIKFYFKDYFFISISLLFIFFSYMYITTSFNSYIFLIIILGLIIIIYSNSNKDIEDSSIIMLDGNINFKNLLKNDISLFLLVKELKKRKINFLSNEYCGILNNGKIQIYQKENKEFPITLILNGNINSQGIKKIYKTTKWLDNYLNENKIKKEEILYAFYYQTKIYIIKK